MILYDIIDTELCFRNMGILESAMKEFICSLQEHTTVKTFTRKLVCVWRTREMASQLE